MKTSSSFVRRPTNRPNLAFVHADALGRVDDEAEAVSGSAALV